jgi:hypothetical protein
LFGIYSYDSVIPYTFLGVDWICSRA